MNPRAAINDLHPFQGCPFDHLGTSPNMVESKNLFNYEGFRLRKSLPLERREWDSNPRALADKRFSRPPRYDHFDISPSARHLNGKAYSIKKKFLCQQLFSKISKQKTLIRIISKSLAIQPSKINILKHCGEHKCTAIEKV